MKGGTPRSASWRTGWASSASRLPSTRRCTARTWTGSPEIVDFAVDVGAGRLEVAHIQYYGWALANRAALMPTREQVKRSAEIVEAARERLKGILVIDFVVPDYYATWPKPCMGGWGRGIVNVTPSGKVLPCHAAETIPGLVFDNVRDRPLADIWLHGQAFETFRGTDWMLEPCRSCERREVDWGGCRCQAFAVAGDARAADPACVKSPRHAEMVALADARGRQARAAVRLPPPAQACVAGNSRKHLRKPTGRRQ